MSSLKPASSYTSCSLHEPVKIRATPESLDEFKPHTIPEFFHESCAKFKDLPALTFQTEHKKNDSTQTTSWTSVTYGEYQENVEQSALALLYLGVPPRTSVSILAANCPEWFYINMATLRINAITTGIYVTNMAEAVFHVLETSNSSVVVVDDTEQLRKVRAIKSRLPQLRAVVQLNGPYDFDETHRVEGYYRWPDLFGMRFSTVLQDELVKREGQMAPNDCALLIFTSGTVGLPKGVMISHDGALYCGHSVSVASILLQPGRESMVSYLPLNHIAAQLFDIFLAIENGANVYIADRNALKGTLTKTFFRAKPTLVFGVPRIFEKIQEKLTQVDEKMWRIGKHLTSMARGVMLQYHMDRMEGKPTSALKYYLASKVTNRIKAALGLDCSRYCYIGGAPVSDELKRFFLSLDVVLINVFGMSEVSGGVIFDFDRPNISVTGKPVGGVEVKIKDPAGALGEGELLLRCRSNLMGYLKEPEKTQETVSEDGWISTGDMAHMDSEGNVYICGRIKELIITAGGENIPPGYIEDLIKKELPCISNALVIGDKRKYLTVLLTFKTKINPHTGYPQDILLPETVEWLEALDLRYSKLSEMLHSEVIENFKNFNPNDVLVRLDDKIQKALEAGIQSVNQQVISRAQKIQYFRVLPHDFSLATEELGPTLKIRRNFVQIKYAPTIDQMYTN